MRSKHSILDLLVVTHRYPTVRQPYLNNFIRQRIHLLKNRTDLNIHLASITPLVIPFTRKWKDYHAELLDSDVTERLYYLSIPRKKLPRITKYFLTHQLIRYTDSLKPNIIHLHWAYPAGMAIPALKERGYKTILTLHGSDIYQNLANASLKSQFYKSLYETDKVLVSGPPLKQKLTDEFPDLPTPIDVIFNIVDPNLFNMKDKGKTNSARKSLGWTNDKIHLLTVANIRKEKGIDVLIKAFQSLENKSNYKLHIVGRPASSSYAKYLNQITADTKYNNITFHDPVPHEILVSYYHAADIYIQPSRREGFGLAMVEAGYCGLPIIATDTGIAHEVTTTKYDRVVKSDNHYHLSKSIEEIADLNPKKSKSYRDYLIKKFGPTSYRNKIKTIYREL